MTAKPFPSPFSGKCLINRAYAMQPPFLLGTHIWSEERRGQTRAFSQEVKRSHQNSSVCWMWEKADHRKPGLPWTYMFQPKKIWLDRETRMKQACSKQQRRETLQTEWGRETSIPKFAVPGCRRLLRQGALWDTSSSLNNFPFLPSSISVAGNQRIPVYINVTSRKWDYPWPRQKMNSYR